MLAMLSNLRNLLRNTKRLADVLADGQLRIAKHPADNIH